MLYSLTYKNKDESWIITDYGFMKSILKDLTDLSKMGVNTNKVKVTKLEFTLSNLIKCIMESQEVKINEEERYNEDEKRMGK